jgi:hypothetical protein
MRKTAQDLSDWCVVSSKCRRCGHAANMPRLHTVSRRLERTRRYCKTDDATLYSSWHTPGPVTSVTEACSASLLIIATAPMAPPAPTVDASWSDSPHGVRVDGRLRRRARPDPGHARSLSRRQARRRQCLACPRRSTTVCMNTRWSRTKHTSFGFHFGTTFAPAKHVRGSCV